MKTKLNIGLLIVGLLAVVAFKFPAEVFKDKVLSEVVLVANGPGETYELINSVLAPNYSAIEAPDCSHESFGRHIDEVFDASLKKNVFRFFMHKTPDNNKCKKDDRQRNEIKTYSNSPDNTLAVKK